MNSDNVLLALQLLDSLLSRVAAVNAVLVKAREENRDVTAEELSALQSDARSELQKLKETADSLG